MLSRRQFAAVLGGASAAAMVPFGAAQASSRVRLTIASSHPTAVPWVGTMQNHVVPEALKRLEAAGSDTRLRWTESYGGALYKFSETLEAVEEGLTDIGWVGTLWEESKMPLQNVTFYAPFMTDDVPTMLRVMNEMHRENAALSAAWANHKQVFLGSSGIETYHLISKEPVENVSQLSGLKVAAAGVVGNWLKGTGAVAVNQGLPGFYNSLKTGVVDAVLISNSGTFPFKLFEVAPYINRVSLGCQVTGAMSINQRSWNRLPDDLKEILTQLGEEYSQVHAQILMENADKFEKMMADQGTTVLQMSDDARSEWATVMPDIAGEWRAFNEGKGIPATEVMQLFIEKMTANGATPLRDWSA